LSLLFLFWFSHTHTQKEREREREREGFATVLFSVPVADFRVAVGFHDAVLLSLCV
jgi:hypothetical protein